MDKKKRYFYIVMGPVLLCMTVLLFSDVLTVSGAQAIGVCLWMIFWWGTRPVEIYITTMVPVVANALLSIVPMSDVVSQYSCESVILLFGSGLLTLPWAGIGLDRRISLKALALIGPSMKSQITVWLLASIVLSNMMPNLAVCAMLTPIAVSMLHIAGYKDIKTAEPAVPILLAIGWGVTLGGAGSPLGGGMNISAISYLEAYTGQEFMYIDWVVRLLPYLVIATVVLLVGMMMIPLKVNRIEGTKEFFKDAYKELGPMKQAEKVCLTMFLLATIGAFTRPLFVDLLPGLTPAYIFLILGFLNFFITASTKNVLLNWDSAQAGTHWGIMILIGGSLALGQLINGSGAGAHLVAMISRFSFHNDLAVVAMVVIFTRLITEITNGTTASAICCPFVFGFAAEMGINPIPLWFITTMAFNAEFVLPLSARAIPVSYGLDTEKMMKYGIPMTLINVVLVIAFGYLALEYWPAFGVLSLS
ncbi:SLC13 family permease [Chakrabartyella piscis]|uniref:SLC13 family permease n=1 Tax=Chakrabartyella piscis TaxID=2918914 RepID=UPI0029589D59|nr:SLC13 family permease [Chakrabartyella piscis]